MPKNNVTNRKTGAEKVNRLRWIIAIFLIVLSAGCYTDIVTTPRLKTLTERRVFIGPIKSEIPEVGQVVRDVIEKECIRKKVELADRDTATIIITGSTFLTVRYTASQTKLYVIGTGAAAGSQAIESVSLVARDNSGEILLSASYDNEKRYTASKLAKELGSAVAKKLR